MAEELLQNQLELQIDIEEVKNLITERKYTRLKEMLAVVNPADMVEIFNAVDKKYTLHFSLLCFQARNPWQCLIITKDTAIKSVNFRV